MRRGSQLVVRGLVLAGAALGTVTGSSVAQCPLELSDTASVTVGEAIVRVCFASRNADGQNVFGHALHVDSTRMLVSYDSLWNTGAVIQVPAAMALAGVPLEPGSYGLYAIPSAADWVLVPSRANSEFGLTTPLDPDAVVGRGLAASRGIEAVERLTISGRPSGSTSGDLVLAWGTREVHIPIRARTGSNTLTCGLRGEPDRLAARPSPPDSVDFTLAGSPARVCYGRPSARDRTVFGGVVPYNDMWRTGANEPTVLHLPVPATVAGIRLDPGKYTVATIPSRKDWVVVINGSTTQWGRVTPLPSGSSSSYTPAVRAQELGRALVPSAQGDHVEQFTITAVPGDAGSVDLVLAWERTHVRIPVRATP